MFQFLTKGRRWSIYYIVTRKVEGHPLSRNANRQRNANGVGIKINTKNAVLVDLLLNPLVGGWGMN